MALGTSIDSALDSGAAGIDASGRGHGSIGDQATDDCQDQRVLGSAAAFFVLAEH
ncbi:MAG: hypothetical protein ACTSX7_20715 [Alphaproteobacteria bacterium]